MHAIVFVGETSGAFGPLADNLPTSLLPIANKLLISYQLDLVANAGVDDVVVCTDSPAAPIEHAVTELSKPGMRVHVHAGGVAELAASLRDSAGAQPSDEPVIVVCGSVLADTPMAGLLAFHTAKKSDATFLVMGKPAVATGASYFLIADERIVPGDQGIDTVDSRAVVLGGIAVINRAVLARVLSHGEQRNAADLFDALATSGVAAHGCELAGYQRSIDSLWAYQTAVFDVACRRTSFAPVGTRIGETVWAGESCEIAPTALLTGAVVVGSNVTIEAGARVRGPVVLGDGCHIGENAVVDNSILLGGVAIETGAVVKMSMLGDGCRVGALASTAEGSVFGARTVVGSLHSSMPTEALAARRRRIKFGTDGWRGIIADDFTGENVRLVTQAVAEYFLADGRDRKPIVVVGYDNRSQSEFFAAEVAKVVAANGLSPILSAQSCSSPAVSYMVHSLGAMGGLMVTASHNPPGFNGLKVKAHYGGSASPAIISMIEARVQRLVAEDYVPVAPSSLMERVELRDFRPAYLGHLGSLVDLKRIARSGLKIVVDSMHGSGAGYLCSMLREAGCTSVLEIRADRNPVFGGVNPEPIEENMAALTEVVIREGADIGIALDGDADRVGAVDGRGGYVDCHRIFSVLLRHLVEQRRWTGAVVKTLSTTRMIDKLATRYGLTLHETPIGFKYVCDLMLAEDVLIGGEESGGIGVKNHIPERDGVLMGLLLLDAMAERSKKLEELIDEIIQAVGPHEYGRIDMHPDAARMRDIVSLLKSVQPAQTAGLTVSEVTRIDGTKLHFADGSWLLLRPSGTEPVVRVYAEAPTTDAVQNLLDAGVALVNSA